jgi:hypothetical protein
LESNQLAQAGPAFTAPVASRRRSPDP